MIVVEGADGSGSRITADFALELGRDVMAVPRPVWNGSGLCAYHEKIDAGLLEPSDASLLPPN